MFDREQIKQALLEGVCTVTFEKTNGELRVMTCTLNSKHIPLETKDESKQKKTKAENPEVQPVYDTKAPGWRSFRWDSIKEFAAGV